MPTKFKLTLSGLVDDQLPKAKLRGQGLEITVSSPDGPFGTLAQYEASLRPAAPTVTFPYSAQTSEGFGIIYQLDRPRTEFVALVSRPKLGVECMAGPLDNLPQAERVVSICLSLRPAAGDGSQPPP